ncbi:hypothetical protein N7507_011296 [Penicillium longicatenatum]|nr:hypothetical protein N7507_011296 [Penicillium longicatenatum]
MSCHRICGLQQPDNSKYIVTKLACNVTIACENSPESVTISGDKQSVDMVLSRVLEKHPGALCRSLRVKVAYHSHHMKEVGEAYEKLLDFVKENDPSIPFFSSVTGDILTSGLGARYWRQNMELPVLFSPATQCILGQIPTGENTLMLEIGPHSVLSAPLRQIFSTAGTTPTSYQSTIVRNSNPLAKIYETAGELYVKDIPIDFLSLNGRGNILTNLPLYSWQHDSTQHWRESRLSRAWRNLDFPRHELLGSRIAETGDLSLSWRNVLSVGDIAWIRDHKVFDDLIYSQLILQAWEKQCQVKSGKDQTLVPDTKTKIREVSSKKWYQGLNQLGLDYGPTFLRLTDIKADPLSKVASASVSPSDSLRDSDYPLHPTTADCALQLLSVAACQGLRRKMKRLVVPILVEHIYIDETLSNVRFEAFSEELENKKLTGSVVGVADGKVVFAFQGCVLAPVSADSSDMDEIDSLNASRLEWTPRMEDTPPAELIFNKTGKPSPAVASESMAVLCMIEAMHEVDSQVSKPRTPYMEQYIEWMRRQVRSMADGTYKLVPQAQDWTKLDRQGRELFMDELSSDPARSWVAPVDALLVRVCRNIKELADGSVSPVDLLYQDEGLKSFYGMMEGLDLSKLFSVLGNAKPTLRVLEIGAGTGGTTALALPGLTQSDGPRLYSRYCYTDISAGFFPAARERFRQYHAIDFAVLDISKDPLEQGFEDEQFDLVIASNVLHATPVLGTALRHVRKLLAPGGRLLLQELCPEARFVNYIMGVLPGWWIGDQDSRVDQPYVSPKRWEAELQASGFTGTDLVVYDHEPPYASNATMVATVISEMSKPKQVTLLCPSYENEQVLAVERQFIDSGYDVRLCSLHDSPLPDGDIISLLDLEGPFFDQISESNLSAIQSLVASSNVTGILWVTRSAQLKCKDPRYALVLGLARTIRSELAIEMGTIEMENYDSAAWAALESIYRTFEARDKTDSTNTDYEFVHQERKVFTSRYKNCNSDELFYPQRGSEPSDDVRLRIETFGRLSSLDWAPLKTYGDLQDDLVEIRVQNAGLNFKDLLCAQGLLDARKEGLGLEGSGVVESVGPHSTLLPGQRVFFMTSGSFSTKVVTSSLLCAPIPDSLSFEDAATMPCVYTTVIHSLVTIGQLRKDQTVLIHSACGGVGLAAIMISQMIGARIYATVGNDEKAKYLEDRFGIPRNRIFNSRNTSFLENVMQKTNGEGVDLVLNSLSGELLHASWKCVARFGKMVEIGKRDIVGNASLSMAPMVQNRSLVSVDLAEILEYQPKECKRLLEQCVELVECGAIEPIRPVRTFSATEIEQAFRYMQAGQHTGKIVVDMSVDLSPTSRIPPAISFSPAHTYLMIGGLGGIGRAVSQWMVEKGARKLVYLSRSAASYSPVQKALLQELAIQGCEVTMVQGDVSNIQDVEKAVQKCSAPIAGIFQMSMVLEDRPFLSMSHAQWATVLLPKVQGNLNLHLATQNEKLDFFVSFSSISGLLGQPGQANYAAANTFLDAFAKYRQSMGLAASVIDLGIVNDIGYVSESGRMTERGLAVWGGQVLQENDVIQAVRLACSGHRDVIVGLAPAARTPLARLPGFFQRDIRMRLFHNEQEAPQASGNVDNGLKMFLADASRDPIILDQPDSLTLLRDELGRKIVSFIFKPDEEIDTLKPLADMGIDSLVVIEIRNWWCQTLGLEISVMEFLNAGNIDGLAHIALKGFKAKFQLKETE